MANRFKKGSAAAKAFMAKLRAAKGKTKKSHGRKIGAAGDYAKFEIATIKSLAKLLKKSLSYTQAFVNNDQNILKFISESFDRKLTPLQTAKAIKQELTPAKKEDKLKAFVDILSKGAKGKTTGRNFPMKLPATVTIGSVKKKAAKKKASARNYGSHKDTGSHNVKIHVVSGTKSVIPKNKKFNLHATIQKMSGHYETLHYFYFPKLTDAKKAFTKVLHELKEKKERGVYTIEIVNITTLKPVKQLTWMKI
jgi:hypothetical protein